MGCGGEHVFVGLRVVLPSLVLVVSLHLQEIHPPLFLGLQPQKVTKYALYYAASPTTLPFFPQLQVP